MNQTLKKAVLIPAVLLILIFQAGCGGEDSFVLESATETGTEEKDTEQHETEPVTEASAQEICVYVCGAVAAEGVYTLPADARAADAAAAAGGLTPEAASGYVNLAEKLQDGMRIYFPTEAELSGGEVPGWAAGSAGMQQENPAAEESATGLVNLNTAGKEELMTLPGVGESKADAILKYREENGGFDRIEDLMNISGIKEGVFNQLKDRITV